MAEWRRELDRVKAEMAALDVRITPHASRLDSLEQSLAESVERLTGLVKAQGVAVEQVRAANRRTPVDLLDSLERQLREAEDRLGGR